MYKNYKLFGFSIKSNIHFYELPVCCEKPDIKIELGKINKKYIPSDNKTNINVISQNEVVLIIEKVAKFHILNGNTIKVQIDENDSLGKSKDYILAICMSIILFQKNILPFHGSGLVKNNKGLIITGISGAGKSSLSFQLRKNGFGFLSDDLCALTKNSSKQYHIQPSFPYQKLTMEMIKENNLSTNDLLQVNNIKQKYLVPVKNSFKNSSVPLLSIYEIVKGNTEKVFFEKLTGMNKLSILASNTFKKEIIRELKMTSRHFQLCGNIAKNINCYRIIRPKNKNTLTSLTNFVLNTLERST